MRLFLLVIVVTFFSCDTTELKEDSQSKKPALSVAKKHPAILQLKPSFKNELENWNEYTTLDTYIKNFLTISPNEALANAKELKDISKAVLDSIRPQFLQTPAFKTRANVMLNESLRLEDMVSIVSITAPEVNNQVGKVLEAYSSINSKINMAISKERLEKEIKVNNYNTLPVDSLDKKVDTKSTLNKFDLDTSKKVKKLQIKKKN